MERRRYMSLALWANERRELKVGAGDVLDQMLLSYPAWLASDDAPEDETSAEPSPYVEASRDAA